MPVLTPGDPVADRLSEAGVGELRLRERTLTEDERAAVVAACSSLSNGNSPATQDELLAGVARCDVGSLAALAAEIGAFGARETDARLLLLNDVPTVADARCALALLSGFLGPIVRYEREGDYIKEIKQGRQLDGARPSVTNSRAFFPHTDLSYIPDPAPYLVMHSLVNNEADGGLSVFCDVERAIARLSPASVRELQKPQFLFPLPAFYPSRATTRFAVLEGATRGWHVRFRRDGLRADTRAGAEAVVELVQVIEERTSELMLQPGTLALIDNRAVLHGRTAFASSSGSTGKRHLNRVYVETAS